MGAPKKILNPFSARRVIAVFFACAFSCAEAGYAEVRLSPLFQDHAVLQRDKPLTIWGTAAAGEVVRVEFAGQSVSSTADSKGAWRVTLASLPASAESRSLTVSGRDSKVESRDVVVGDIWLCSGQSNMEFKLKAVDRAADELAHADRPLIRHARIGIAISHEPKTDCKTQWVQASRETAGEFTAIGFLFAREIQEKLPCVPIGLINSSLGATNIEAWIPPAAIQSDPDLGFVRAEWAKVLANYPALKAEYDRKAADRDRKAEEARAAGKPFSPPWIGRPPAEPIGPPHADQPSAMFNGMIAPLGQLSLRGILWYQGENNVGPAIKPGATTRPDSADRYRLLMPTLVRSWRDHFKDESLPVYWVQLPGWQYSGPENVEAAYLREAQSNALSLANTGQAVAIDVGHPRNIHPPRKQPVAHRLACLALNRTYGIGNFDTGPTLRSASFDGPITTLHFVPGDGLKLLTPPDADAPPAFELAGRDRAFYPATATVSRHTLVLTSPNVPAPVAARYAWRNVPTATLYSEADLPAGPFRTDDW